MTEETKFFQYADVTVTNSRFMVGGQTFAMSNITSVKASQSEPNRFWPIVLIIFGALALLSGSFLSGGGLLLGGIIWLVTLKTMYHVMLTTAGGETSALQSEQREYIEKVVQALNDAIVARG